ncbi:MAG: efflux RND transporter periplasmic adaptor subunit [Deltaproteobacteria bacterium]|nr:efflux RND transporter periplasmic adaptor subunit [Nannocystaceae bacterium]
MLSLVAIAAVAGLTWTYLRSDGRAEAPPSAKGAVPVVAAAVEQRDVAIRLTGLGTVRAWNSVTVRPRVGGQLLSVEFVEGQRVKEGDVLARIDPRTYKIARDQASAKLAQDESRLDGARRQLQASRQLLSAKAAGQLEFDAAAATVGELEGLVRGDRAAIAETKLQLEYATVVAPISGRTGLRRIDPGNLVAADAVDGIVVITQLQPIAVVFSLPQDRLAEARAALRRTPAPVVQALGDGDVVLAEGELVMIDNAVDPQTGTISLKARFANEDDSLWPGQFVTARLQVDTRAGVLVVPEQAIQSGADGPFVYVIGDDDTVSVRPVKRGAMQDGATIVDDGVVAGERVVVEGQAKLAPGLVVDAREATP